MVSQMRKYHPILCSICKLETSSKGAKGEEYESFGKF